MFRGNHERSMPQWDTETTERNSVICIDAAFNLTRYNSQRRVRAALTVWWFFMIGERNGCGSATDLLRRV